MSTHFLRNWLPALVILALGLGLPLVIESGFQLRLAMLICIYAVFGMGFNMLFGLAGQLSLGQQAFFAIGGYTFALLQIHYAVPWPLAMLAGAVVCAIVSLVIAVPVLRMRSHYLAMATLMFAMIVHDVALRWTAVTGGSSGLQIPSPVLFGVRLGRLEIYYLILAIAVLAFLVQIFIKSTHLGRALEAIKVDETAASSLGIPVNRYKTSIYVLAAVFAAVAGMSFAIVSRSVDPAYSTIGMVVNLLTLTVVGGLGSRIGPFLGAAIVILAPQLLAGLQEYETLIYGVGLLLFIIFVPCGLAGLIERAGGASKAGTAGTALPVGSLPEAKNP